MPYIQIPGLLQRAGVFLLFGSFLAFESYPFLAMTAQKSLWMTFCLFVIQAGIYGFVLALLFACVPRNWFWKGGFLLLALVGACTLVAYYRFSVIMNTSMMENILATDKREAFEFISWRLVLSSLLIFMPYVVLACVRDRVGMTTSFWKRILQSLVCLLVALVAFGGLLTVSNQFMPLMRQQRQARFLAIPASSVYSFVRAVFGIDAVVSRERTVIDSSPRIEAQSTRPLFVLMVVGETARAKNWGLSGYSRNTTPELAKRGVINFPDVKACGSSTSVSLPCMFSRVGREDYFQKRIEEEESILWVIARAGVRVRWVENQGGAKGACPPDMVIRPEPDQQYCDSEDCLDMVLRKPVADAIRTKAKPSHQLMVLHTMGSHGPAYWRRTPSTFRPFGQGCLNDDMTTCSRQDVTDSYDNSIAYTDRFLARLIDDLSVEEADTVLLYVSDHGESLGEGNLWLHGAPWWMAPDEQLKVPMILWMNEGAKKRFSIDAAQVERTRGHPLSHDYLASTLLALTEVQSKVWDARKDIVLKLQFAVKAAERRR